MAKAVQHSDYGYCEYTRQSTNILNLFHVIYSPRNEEDLTEKLSTLLFEIFFVLALLNSAERKQSYRPRIRFYIFHV